MPTYWLVTMFDAEKRMEQFHTEGSSAADAVDYTAHILVKSRFNAVEVHVQKITPEEKDALVRRRP